MADFGVERLYSGANSVCMARRVVSDTASSSCVTMPHGRVHSAMYDGEHTLRNELIDGVCIHNQHFVVV